MSANPMTSTSQEMIAAQRQLQWHQASQGNEQITHTYKDYLSLRS